MEIMFDSEDCEGIEDFIETINMVHWWLTCRILLTRSRINYTNMIFMYFFYFGENYTCLRQGTVPSLFLRNWPSLA